jgi:hypothetical protein
VRPSAASKPAQPAVLEVVDGESASAAVSLEIAHQAAAVAPAQAPAVDQGDRGPLRIAANGRAGAQAGAPERR